MGRENKVNVLLEGKPYFIELFVIKFITVKFIVIIDRSELLRSSQ